jgi:hypothetical protein
MTRQEKAALQLDLANLHVRVKDLAAHPFKALGEIPALIEALFRLLGKVIDDIEAEELK